MVNYLKKKLFGEMNKTKVRSVVKEADYVRRQKSITLTRLNVTISCKLTRAKLVV